VLLVHLAAKPFPPMSEAELRELGADIIKNGLTSPIVLWRADPKAPAQLLDGRNRLDAIELVTGKPVEIGAPSVMAGEDFLACDKVIVLDGKKTEPYAYVISANLHRRHLTGEQKRDLIAALLKATPEKSNRHIADTVKASHHTVEAVRTKMESTGQIAQLPKTVGKDRRARSSKRKRSTPVVPKPSTETVVPEAVAPDDELDLLREFARFVIGRARVSTDPKDQIEWKVLLDRVNQVLGVPSHLPDCIPDSPRRTPPEVGEPSESPVGASPPHPLDIPDFLRRPPPGSQTTTKPKSISALPDTSAKDVFHRVGEETEGC
jgi:hypothetical protein